MSKVVDIVVAGGKLIAGLTANTTDDKAVSIVAGARAILGVLEAGVAGSLTPEECVEALDKLADKLQELQANDAAADAELDKRFPAGDP